ASPQLSMVDVLKFSYADVIARANRTSVEAAADQWIHEAMDEDTAADYDYVTVFEEGAPEQEELVPAQPQVADLQQRVRELEALVASQSLSADVAKVGAVVQSHAAVELGLDSHQVGLGMMR
ncbi:unnamed protein product, partial [Durusdinium trenchii]